MSDGNRAVLVFVQETESEPKVNWTKAGALSSLQAFFKVCKEKCWCSIPDSKSNIYCEKVLTLTGKLSSFLYLSDALTYNRQCVAYSMYSSCERVISAVRKRQWHWKCLAPIISDSLHFRLSEQKIQWKKERKPPSCSSVVWLAHLTLAYVIANNIKLLSKLKWCNIFFQTTLKI